MARVRNIENLIISAQNVIPQLAEIPIDNVAMVLSGGAPAIPQTEYTISGKTITWNDVEAGYNLEIGEIAVVDYEYENGISEGGGGGVTPPYDASDSSMNTVLVQYTTDVAEEDIVPKLIHVPVADTLIVKVNGIVVTEGVDWTRDGRTLTWISGTTLNVNDIVYTEYRRNL